MEKSKYYYDFKRNLNCEENCFCEKNKKEILICKKLSETAETAETADPVGFSETCLVSSNIVSLSSSFSSDDEDSMPSAKDMGIPSYYIGRNGYEARKVVANFDLSYNIGTATTYLLRCGKKKENGMSDKDKHIEDINKAINHLKFEISKLQDEK